MQVILLERVAKLGQMGEVVKVKEGFARNYLLPQGMATFATPHNLRIVEKHRERLRQLEAAKRADLLNLAAQIAQRSITIEANANAEGHLYGSVTADQIANGTRGLLDEVATGKVTGEEEYWSRTDLWDFQANVDGARVGFDGLRPLLQRKDPELDTQIDERFTALQTLLDAQKEGDGFVSYDELSAAEVKGLSDAVNALSEPLSKLTAAVARAAGDPAMKVKSLPWALLACLSPFNRTLRELMEVKRFWRAPVRLDNARLLAFLGPEAHTPLDEAVRATLVGLGCLAGTPASAGGEPAGRAVPAMPPVRPGLGA